MALGTKNPAAQVPHLRGGIEEPGARALALALPVTPSSSSSSGVLPAETKEGFQLHLIKLTAPLVRVCMCEHMCACCVYLRCVSSCAWVLCVCTHVCESLWGFGVAQIGVRFLLGPSQMTRTLLRISAFSSITWG